MGGDFLRRFFSKREESPRVVEVPRELPEQRYILRVNGERIVSNGHFEGNIGSYDLRMISTYGSHDVQVVVQMNFSRKIVNEMHFFHEERELPIEDTLFSQGIRVYGPTVSDKLHLYFYSTLLGGKGLVILFVLKDNVLKQDNICLLS